jgi:hypothetical protein
MPTAEALLRDVAATMQTVIDRLTQIPEDAILSAEVEEAIESLFFAARMLRRYR